MAGHVRGSFFGVLLLKIIHLEPRAQTADDPASARVVSIVKRSDPTEVKGTVVFRTCADTQVCVDGVRHWENFRMSGRLVFRHQSQMPNKNIVEQHGPTNSRFSPPERINIQ